MQLPQPGDLFAGRYQVETLLGEGGFATVYRAVDLESQSPVALKILRPQQGDEYRLDTRARFKREVGILDRLKHPHIVNQLAYGESSDGVLHVVFELLPGRDLADVLEEAGRLSPIVVVSVLRQLLMALDAAHLAGLLHRDLKPQNIRVIESTDDSLTVKLMDFGIARSTDAGHPSITKTGELIGTPRYMSPEQLRGVALGPASDIYSLGLIAFELLMGTSALAGNSIFEQIARMNTGHLLSVPELERANPALLAMIQRMTEKAPEKRFQSARATLTALNGVAAFGGAPAGAMGFDATMAPEIVSPQPRPAPPQPTAKGLRGAPAIAIVGLSAVALMALVYTRFASTNQETVQPTTTQPKRSVGGVVERVRVKSPGSPSVGDEEERDVGEPAPIADLPETASAGCKRDALVEPGRQSLGKILSYIPKNYSRDRAHPVVMLLHDRHDEPPKLLDASGFIGIADAHGVVVVAPTDRADRSALESHRVAQARRQLEFIVDELCIDRARIFVVSQGKGGRAAAPLACEGWVTAVAMNSFALRDLKEPDSPYSTDMERYGCDVPKPMALFRPSESREVPLNGANACDGRVHFTRERMEAIWQERNSCSGEPIALGPHAGGECRTWACQTPLMSCVLTGGYPWPGTKMAPRDASKCGSEPSPDFQLGPTIWEFFEKAPVLDPSDVLGDRN